MTTLEILKKEEETLKTEIELLTKQTELFTSPLQKEIHNKAIKSLQRNLSSIQSRLEKSEMNSDEFSFVKITNSLISDTIEAYFVYHIWTHPEMVKALQDVEENIDNLAKYSSKIRKWLSVFRTKKYMNEKRQRLAEWMEHKSWVCIDNPSNPFSFKNTVTFRGNMDPHRLQNILDGLCEWSLENLIDKQALYHSTAQRQEKEKLYKLRKKMVENGLVEETEVRETENEQLANM
ncbi:hypothetical protein M0P65_05515 [Candidatus Gracilibacteria bacterium]|nr:hypothetical protein [Candidatus Gracilibacteria bacterium]